MKKLFAICILILCSNLLNAQGDIESVKLKVSGFVKNDIFWDSRQTVAGREGHLLLFPAEVSFDNSGNDVNAKPNFNILAVQSRIAVNASGPEAFGAKITGLIEGDFFGQANDNINLFRLRYAYFNMKWKSIELITGQYAVPMFINECFPGTVSFNTGLPFQPGVRNPQIRVIQTVGKFNITFIASTQRDYASSGPIGASGNYLRNSGIPEFDGQIQFVDKSEAFDFTAGMGFGYKNILPQLKTPQGFKTDSKVESFAGIAYLKIKIPAITFKMYGLYGKNMSDVLSLGGYGVTDSLDLVKGFVSYSPISIATFWSELQTNGTKLQFGIFGACAFNLGASDIILGPIYGVGTNIKSMYRIAPRVILNSGKVRFALETEFTSALYGSKYSQYAVPEQFVRANNIRFLLGTYYFF